LALSHDEFLALWSSFFYHVPVELCVIRTRLRFDRARLNRSLFVRKLVDSPLCDCDMSCDETVEHVLLECSHYDPDRQACEADMAKWGLPMSMSILLGEIPPDCALSYAAQADVHRTASAFLRAIHDVRDF
jgi:hypothetical protein